MMSGYTAMLCLLPAFLAAITSAFGLRAAYVRSSRQSRSGARAWPCC